MSAGEGGTPLVQLTVALPIATAYALAELCKRIGWSDLKALSVDEGELYRMIAATDAVRSALRDHGVDVR